MPALPEFLLPLSSIGYEYVPWWGNMLLAIWIWCFGANVGSFMNVVIYRVPAGLSVVHPGSRCPKCLRHIRWYDNVPMLSWLLLRARCRYCGQPISSRYPMLEATVAVIFLLLAFVGPPTGGANLPHAAEFSGRPSDVALWLIYVYQLCLVITLICATMIRRDGHPLPRRLFVPAAIVAVVAPVSWAVLPRLLGPRAMWSWVPLHPVSFHDTGALPGAESLAESAATALLNCMVGAAVGCSLGLIAANVGPPEKRRLQGSDVPAIALCGSFLGWQAVCFSAAAAAVLDLASVAVSSEWSGLRRVPWLAYLTGVTVLLLCVWSWLVEQAPWLGAHATMATFAAAAVMAATASFLGTKLALPATIQAPPSMNGSHMPGESIMSQPAEGRLSAILNAPSYRLAEEDTEFLKQDELRPVRLQLELLKPEMALIEQGVHSTIVVFGGTQIVEREEAEARLSERQQLLNASPDNPRAQRAVERAKRVLAKAEYYDAARAFGRLVSSTCQIDGHCEYVVVTGGGPGIMEAANRGAYDVGAKSIGFNITLPHEQAPNPYITPELCFQFHYFALRKMHFLLRAKALVVFPGGFGTLDELFDALTLRQTQRMQAIPIVLYGKQYWKQVLDFEFLADEGVIADEHLDLIHYAETPEEAWQTIATFHGLRTPTT